MLGDSLTADLARRRLVLLSPAEMTAAIAEAADDWHRTLYAELADLELLERSARGDVLAKVALADLGGVVPAEIQELENALAEFERDGNAILDGLDVTAWRVNLGDVYGVNPEYIPVGVQNDGA
ncbi:MAG: hypothetical protein HY328_00425 [Chloroflexi bacterium]|nr:hypothetical protein [Chloroflexota bacterium]